LQVQLQELQTEMKNVTNQSLCSTTSSSNASSSDDSNKDNNNSSAGSNENILGRGRQTPITESSINDMVQVLEYTNATTNHDGDDEMMTATVIETNIWKSQPTRQQQNSPRNAIDHGRLLLQRLDSPRTTTKSAVNSNPSYTQ
jgi:hypothetical protein